MNSALCVVLFGCLFGLSLALSLNDDWYHLKNNDITGELRSGNNDETATKLQSLFSKIQKAFQGSEPSFDYIFRNLQELFNFSIINVGVSFTSSAYAFLARAEMLSVANGTHMIASQPTESELDYQHRVKSVAICKMWRDLSVMKKTDELLVAITEDAAREILVRTDMHRDIKTSLRDILKLMFEKWDHVMEFDATLHSIYKQRREEAEREVERRSPPVRSSTFDIDDDDDDVVMEKLVKELSRPHILVAVINKAFINRASKHIGIVFSKIQKDQYAIGQAYIRVSKNYPEINKYYQQSLEQTVLSVNGSQVYFNADEVSRKLFDCMNDKLYLQNQSLAKIVFREREAIQQTLIVDSSVLKVNILPL